MDTTDFIFAAYTVTALLLALLCVTTGLSAHRIRKQLLERQEP